MALLDISRLISSDAVVYPGDPLLCHSVLSDIGPASPCRITALDGWTTHVLTHLDAPRHFIAGGRTLDRMPLQRFLCDAVIVEAFGDMVTQEDVASAGDLAGKALLFKTRNSRIATAAPFDRNHVFLSEAAARAAVAAGANLVGMDYLSVDRYGDGKFPVHRTLLGQDVLILEGLDLSAVAPGAYRLSALPLRIDNADGSPVRAVLLRD